VPGNEEDDMTYPPPGGSPDPYQPQQPYGQPHEPAPPYGQDPYASPSSGAPSSGQPFPPPAYSPPQYGSTGPNFQQPYSAPVVATTNTMAILALVFAFIFPLAAIFLGHVAKKQIRQTGEQGEGLATAGLVLGYIFTGITVAFCTFGLIAGILGANSDPNY
jgi:hypothetical protein